MSAKDIKEEKKFITKGQDDKQKLIVYKPFKNKVEGLEDEVDTEEPAVGAKQVKICKVCKQLGAFGSSS